MPLLNYHKSNWRLVIGLQGCTGLSDGIKFIQQYLIELSLADTIPVEYDSLRFLSSCSLKRNEKFPAQSKEFTHIAESKTREA
jgi:hypothetical protein